MRIGMILTVVMGYTSAGLAEINANIGIGMPLPKVVIPAPPTVVLIPSTYVYFVPDTGVDLLVSSSSRALLQSDELQWAMGCGFPQRSAEDHHVRSRSLCCGSAGTYTSIAGVPHLSHDTWCQG